MPTIRKSASVGDIVIGMAGKGHRGLGRIYPQLIYWMSVGETLTFDQYWQDQRFTLKIPKIPGPKMRMVGDRTYRHHHNRADWICEPSMHYIPGPRSRKDDHIIKDTSVDRVLVGQRFTYWGKDGPRLPDHLQVHFSNPRNQKCKHKELKLLKELHDFVNLAEPRGMIGEPTDWNNDRYFKEI